MSSSVFTPFSLPNGHTIKNRIAKAAMEENMAQANQLPGHALFNLYREWAKGGVGLIITGNVMVDHLAMTGPGGLALESTTPLAPFQQLATMAKQNGTRLWMQINHPGRQVFKKMGGKVLSPSDIPLNMGKHSSLFGQPKAMTNSEIEDVILRFVTTASLAKEAGYDGVQIHAAHGYLLAQFLSPLTNKRQDQWGGSLDNRARMLLRIVQEVRQQIGDDFDVAVKLNSADFQRGGFDVEDAQRVVAMLAQHNVDMVELSGGSYEAPAMQGRTADDRTLAREAYFLSFAKEIARSTTLPIMTTGGIRKLSVAENVLESGIDMVGIASALALTPDLPNRWLTLPDVVGVIPVVNWKDKTLSGLATMAQVKRQLRRIGKGKTPSHTANPVVSLILDQIRSASLTKRYRKQYAEEVE